MLLAIKDKDAPPNPVNCQSYSVPVEVSHEVPSASEDQSGRHLTVGRGSDLKTISKEFGCSSRHRTLASQAPGHDSVQIVV